MTAEYLEGRSLGPDELDTIRRELEAMDTIRQVTCRGCWRSCGRLLAVPTEVTGPKQFNTIERLTGLTAPIEGKSLSGALANPAGENGELAVYLGRTLCGFVSDHRSGQYAARLADGRQLGLFTTWRGAADAISTSLEQEDLLAR
jgi:hypothetical protein